MEHSNNAERRKAGRTVPRRRDSGVILVGPRAEEILKEVRRGLDELGSAIQGQCLAEAQLLKRNQSLLRTRNELSRGAGYWKELFDQAPVGYVTTDQRGRVLEANQAALSILSVSRSKLVRTNLKSLLDSASQHVFAWHHQAAFTEGRKQACAVCIRNGAGHWLEFRLEAGGAEGVGSRAPNVCRIAIIDINGEAEAERKRDEAARARLAALVASSSAAIVATDLSGRIDHWNPAAEALFGYPAEKIIGQNISLLVPSDLEEERRKLVASIHNGAPPRQIETIRLHQSGERIEVALTLSLIRCPDDNIIGYAAILQDIRHQRQLERQVTAAAEAEKQRIGMELHDSLGSLLTVIDCRTTSFSRTLEKIGHRSEATEALGIAIEIRGAIRNLRSLASGLQPLDGQPESLIVALRNLASRTCRIKRMQCRFLAPRQPLILRDAAVSNHLFSIASEAVQNAVRHSGGTRITIQLKDRDGVITLSIVDNGRGFPVEKMKSTGMGLGTMNCRAHLIGGRLSIQRRRGGGTRVVCEAGRIVNRPASA